MEQLLDICLQWKATLLNNALSFNYSKFVQEASTTQLFIRPKHELSPYFWQRTSAIPQLRLSGPQNIALLQQALSVLAIELYPDVLTLNHIYEDKVHLIFHGYRKLMRSIETICTMFQDQVFVRSNCTTPAVNLIDVAYGKFGDVNDIIAAYEFYRENGPKKKEKEAEEEVNKNWAKLQLWMKTEQLMSQFVCLVTSLIPLPTPP